MPNWCYNSLLFRGKAADLEALVRRVHGDHCHLGFAKVVPEPPGLGEDRSPGGLLPGWYEWRCQNWGTKWDIDAEGNSSVSATPFFGELVLGFDTAWSPSLPVTDATAKMFPAVEMDHMYCDESMGSAGRALWRGGKLASMREFPHGTREYDLVTRGIRPEEGEVAECDWTRGFPTSLAKSRISGKPRTSPPENRHPPTLDSLLARMEAVTRLGVASSEAAAAAAAATGFPMEEWLAAGLPIPRELSWSTAISQLPSSDSPTPLHICCEAPPPGTRPTRHRAARPPTLLLAERSHLPRSPVVRGMGRIVRLDSGYELVSPSGWSVSASVREGEAVVVVSKDGLCQTPPDGSPSCLHWKTSPSTGRPFLFATAFCAGGKLWDPARGVPAYSEYQEDGGTIRTASFFAGKLRGGSVRTAVVEFAGGPPRRPLRRPRVQLTATSPQRGQTV